MKVTKPLCILTIAGSDSGGGAGVQADLRTIHSLGAYGCSVITAVTAQNMQGVQSWEAEPPALVRDQLESVLSDLNVVAIKTGLLPDAATIRVIARALEAHPRIPLVIDPVTRSSSGVEFLDKAGLSALRRHLLPRAILVTPNWAEAEELTGSTILTHQEAGAAAILLAGQLGTSVLVKGGHAPGDLCVDALASPEGSVRFFEDKRVVTNNTHGTGCVLSAAIATGLGLGLPLQEAIGRAKEFLTRALVAGRHARWGGRGPAFASGV